MTATQVSVAQQATANETQAETWSPPSQECAALQAAVARLLKSPLDDSRVLPVTEHIERLIETSPGGARALKKQRAARRQQLGNYSNRFVATKHLSPQGEWETLPRPRPARNGFRDYLARVARQHKELYPRGVRQLIEQEQPIVQAPTAQFTRLIDETVRSELHELPQLGANGVRMILTDLLDLLVAYRHGRQLLVEAHAAALEQIDAGEFSKLIEFLVSVAARTPLTESEFAEFIASIRHPPERETQHVAALRERVVRTGLAGSRDLLRQWVTPFVRELAMHGRIRGLLEAYKSRELARPVRLPQTASPAKAAAHPSGGTRKHPGEERPAQGGVAQKAAARPALPPIESVDETSIGTMGDARMDFVIPVGATEPSKLDVLRNYIHCATIGTAVPLPKAMKMAQADPDVVGHRQYVMRVFRDEGWVMVPRGKQDPVFERRPRERIEDGG